MKILIADDDPLPRRLLQATLTKWGYEVVTAREGTEAWDLLQQPDAPRLAILDWLMPGMDGAAVCRKVREREQGREGTSAAAGGDGAAPYVYLILLTSRDAREDVLEGMDAGADDYLTKPFDPHKLQVRLRAGCRILDLQTALLDSLSEVREAEKNVAQARSREGAVGGKIQQTLLLGHPPQSVPGLRVAALTLPSQQIDGDFYDFFEQNDHCLDVLVGDVMGKGIPAALLGAAVKSHFLRALSRLLLLAEPKTLPRPDEIVSLVHAEVTRQFIGLDSFVTLCYARFDLRERRVTFVDCGHTKTVHLHAAEDRCDLLEGESMPLGFSERETYGQTSVPFAPGDVFFFYSDGVTEAQDASSGEQFGVERLVTLVRANGDLTPDALIETVRAAVVAHSDSETFADDLTCVAVRIAGAAPAAAVPATLEVTSRLTELETVRAFVRRFCQALPSPAALPDHALDQLELAVNEAASNVMRHAYEGRADGRLLIETDADDGRVRVRLCHWGRPFDPAAASPPAFDGSREGGFGVYLIAQCVDEVEYGQDEHGQSHVTLVKHRGVSMPGG